MSASDQNHETDSIFTKIIKGEIPCHKLYEDDRTFAFMDIHPAQPGHLLVIPKKQIEQLWDLEPADYQAVMATANKLAHALRVCFPDKTHVSLIVQGLDVPHTHLHLYPFSTSAEFNASPDHNQEPDHSALASTARRIIAALDV